MHVWSTIIWSGCLLLLIAEASPLEPIFNGSSFVPASIGAREEAKNALENPNSSIKDWVPELPAQTRKNCKGSFMCQFMMDGCKRAASRYVDDLVYRNYTSYTHSRKGSFSSANSCTAIFGSSTTHPWHLIHGTARENTAVLTPGRGHLVCEDDKYGNGMTGRLIKAAFFRLFHDGIKQDCPQCGSSYMENGCHVTANNCNDCEDVNIDIPKPVEAPPLSLKKSTASKSTLPATKTTNKPRTSSTFKPPPSSFSQATSESPLSKSSQSLTPTTVPSPATTSSDLSTEPNLHGETQVIVVTDITTVTIEALGGTSDADPTNPPMADD